MTDAVLLAGNPNVGKTTLFNRWSGAKARVGNYPGVTVDRRSAQVELAGARELVDLPGTYSLTARSPEEEIAVTAVLEDPSAIIVVVDATTLRRGLYLALQVLETDRPTVVALNMMDEAKRDGIEVDVDALSRALGVPVVPVVASNGEGLKELKESVASVIGDPRDPLTLDYGDATSAISALQGDDNSVARATWLLLSVGDDELELEASVRARVTAVQRDGLDEEIIGARYALVDALVDDHVTERTNAGPSRSDRIDSFLVHPVTGTLAFVFTMYLVFEALFSWSDPLIGLVEALVGWAQGVAGEALGEGMLSDLIVDGVIAGVGNVIVFVPQIALLFLFIGFLEDSGYLARVAFLIDRVMKKVGLHGRAFVPLLSGFACAIPAVMATRTIENRRDRLVTMLALPLMSCSARLPVYVLVIAVIFAHEPRVFGFMSAGAAALLGMYLLSVVGTLVAAAVLRRVALPGPAPALVLELPPYRWPVPRNLLASTWTRVRSFLVDAGTIILALTIVLWALLYFPRGHEATDAILSERAAITAQQSEGEADVEALAAIDDRVAASRLQHSYAGELGRAIEPVIKPLGFDWRVGIGILASFAAREVFVSTMGIVFGISEADEESQPLRASLSEATWPDGRKLFTPASGIALMVFFVFAAQCMSTIAVIKRESGSWKWPLVMFAYMTLLAYVASFIAYRLGTWFA